jgi:hypothetical protein
VWVALLIGVQGASASWPKSADPTGRYLVDADGKPFFWLGDTAWMLFQEPDREDAEHYLATRARRTLCCFSANSNNDGRLVRWAFCPV